MQRRRVLKKRYFSGPREGLRVSFVLEVFCTGHFRRRVGGIQMKINFKIQNKISNLTKIISVLNISNPG